MNKSTTIASTDENTSFQQVKTNGINSQVSCTFSKHVVMSCITAVRAIHFVTVNVMWQPGSSLQPMWQELPHTFCFKSALSSLNLSRRLGGRFGGLPGLAPPVQRIIVMSRFQTKQPGESRSCQPIQGWVWSNQIGTKRCLAWCPVLSQL